MRTALALLLLQLASISCWAGTMVYEDQIQSMNTPRMDGIHWSTAFSLQTSPEFKESQFYNVVTSILSGSNDQRLVPLHRENAPSINVVDAVRCGAFRAAGRPYGIWPFSDEAVEYVQCMVRLLKSHDGVLVVDVMVRVCETRVNGDGRKESHHSKNAALLAADLKKLLTSTLHFR